MLFFIAVVFVSNSSLYDSLLNKYCIYFILASKEIAEYVFSLKQKVLASFFSMPLILKAIFYFDWPNSWRILQGREHVFPPRLLHLVLPCCAVLGYSSWFLIGNYSFSFMWESGFLHHVKNTTFIVI